MKRLTRQWCMMMGLLSLAGTAGAAPPANDNFANAINLGGAATVNTTGDNTEATLEAGEPDGPFGLRKGSAWFRWTAPASGWVELDTEGSGFDTLLAVGTGASIGTYSEIVFNDEDPEADFEGGMFSGESRLFFEAQAGTVYRIACCRFSSNEGAFQLHIAPSEPPVATMSAATTVPESVDVTNAAAAVTFALTAQTVRDDDFVNAYVDTTNGFNLATLSLGKTDVTAGSVLNGTRSGVLTIPRYLPSGDYPLAYQIYDSVDQVLLAHYGQDYNGFLPFLGTLKSVISVTNTGVVDTAGPEVTAFAFSPSTVDVSAGDAIVTCTFTLSDPLAGAFNVDLSIRDATGDQVAFAFVEPKGSSGLTGGDQNLGMYSVAMTIPQGSAPRGYYFRCSNADRIGNFRRQNSAPAAPSTDGPLPGNPVLTVFNSNFVGSPFDQWATGNGLVPPGNGETDVPFTDGVANLLKYAFNMDGSGPDHHVLVPGSGGSGLPSVYRSAGGITVEYVVRSGASADSRLSYTVETSTNGMAFVPSGIAGTSTAINGSWNRVRVEIPVTTGGAILARLSVDYAP